MGGILIRNVLQQELDTDGPTAERHMYHRRRQESSEPENSADLQPRTLQSAQGSLGACLRCAAQRADALRRKISVAMATLDRSSARHTRVQYRPEDLSGAPRIPDRATCASDMPAVAEVDG